MDAGTELLDLNELCASTGLGRTRIYQEITSGRLRSLKVGRRRLVPRSALDQWISDRLEENVR